jgi:hypothetical protein
MCTVSYFPLSSAHNFILTSNRDEKDFRATLPPAIHKLHGTSLLYPKDEQAGGSWITANNKGRVCCLLNGAFIAHEKQDFHTVSRGTILLELSTSALSVDTFFAGKNLSNVEPFTIVSIEQKSEQIGSLCEFVWDGNEKHFRQLDSNAPYIWSSVTLYNKEQRKERKEWFTQFLAEAEGELSAEQIFAFHSGSHTHDNSINLVMQRGGGLKTVSITQIRPQHGNLQMTYFDMLSDSKQQLAI